MSLLLSMPVKKLMIASGLALVIAGGLELLTDKESSDTISSERESIPLQNSLTYPNNYEELSNRISFEQLFNYIRKYNLYE